MTRDRLVDAYVEWLTRFQWQWWCTLTCRGFPSASRANRLFRRWIQGLERTFGTAGFRWVKVLETGRSRDNAHLHVLVGGLREWDAAVRVLSIRRWVELAGDAPRISYYHRNEHGIRYMVKTLDPYQDFDIEFQLDPKKTGRRR